MFNRRSGLFFREAKNSEDRQRGKKEELFPLASQRKNEEGPPNRRLNIFKKQFNLDKSKITEQSKIATIVNDVTGFQQSHILIHSISF